MNMLPAPSLTKRMPLDESHPNKPPRLQSPEIDENGCVRYSMSDAKSIENISGTLETVVERFHEFQSLALFMTQGDNANVPGIKTKMTELHEHFWKCTCLLSEFTSGFAEELDSLNETFDKAYEEVGKQAKWWESVNIFSPDVDCEVLRNVQDIGTKPNDSEEYANYIRRSMRVVNKRREWMSNTIDMDWFTELLREERDRIWQMNDSFRVCFNPDMDIKLNLLQDVEQMPVLDRHMLALHETIDVCLSNDLDIAYYNWVDHTAPAYVDAANACRRVRERMDRKECRAYHHSDEICVYNLLLPTLDTLQRHAYEEIRINVDMALSGRLPAELAFLVFEFTMAAEQVPLDPRVFVNATHKDPTRDEHARKTRLICPHWAKYHERLRIVPERPLLVFGDDWIEKKRFMHFNLWKRQEKNRQYEWSRFGDCFTTGGRYEDSETQDEEEWEFEDEDDEVVEMMGARNDTSRTETARSNYDDGS